VTLWTEVNWIGPMLGFCEHDDELLVSIKARNFLIG
jgi:hypothetical protein